MEHEVDTAKRNTSSYYLMRRLFSFGLGAVYFNAFLIYFNQGVGLYGKNGLLPYDRLIPGILSTNGSLLESFWTVFSVFIFSYSDFTIGLVGILGMVLSLFLVFGRVNFPILLTLWFLQISIIHVGQIFYSYGWETQLLELTFLSFFLFPLIRLRLDRRDSPPKLISIWFMRWMMFRLMLGAGLIKIRGDECWRNLTCMNYHYETQPNPNPLSWLLHQFPQWYHWGEVFFNHTVELIFPFLLFGPRKIRQFAAIVMIGFQVSLIFSGNLAWLNWITIVMAIPFLDDALLKNIFPFGRTKKYLNICPTPYKNPTYFVLACFLIVGIALSIQPALNLISPNQRMNTSYNRWHLINSYGAFGSIGKERPEIVISGTLDAVLNKNTQWLEYEFFCKPGKLHRRPCLISPYHFRVDWQIWFSAMRPQLSEVWLLRLGIGFLEDNQNILDLIDHNPFEEDPPKFIKMDLYQYNYTNFGTKNWWTRKYVSPYVEPISLQNPVVQKHR